MHADCIRVPLMTSLRNGGGDGGGGADGGGSDRGCEGGGVGGGSIYRISPLGFFVGPERN